jgi:uncharacterized Zn-binding protein involved in type VI secretion
MRCMTQFFYAFAEESLPARSWTHQQSAAWPHLSILAVHIGEPHCHFWGGTWTTTEGNTMEYTEEDGLRLAAEFVAKLAARPVKGHYPAATETSTTERGGKVISTSGFATIGGRVALVGDLVRYPDGSEARIVSGASVVVYRSRPMAIVGSELNNGDRITSPMHNGIVVVQYANEAPIVGLLDRSYVPTRSPDEPV